MQNHYKYIDFVKQQTCCVHPRKKGIQAHHLKTRGAGGDDLDCIPLCYDCHYKIHQLGIESFQARYNINLHKARADLLAQWIRMNNRGDK